MTDSPPALPCREGAECIRLDERCLPSKVIAPSLKGGRGEGPGGRVLHFSFFAFYFFFFSFSSCLLVLIINFAAQNHLIQRK